MGTYLHTCYVQLLINPQALQQCLVVVLYMTCACRPGTAVGNRDYPNNYIRVRDAVLRLKRQSDGKIVGVWLVLHLRHFKGYQYSSAYR